MTKTATFVSEVQDRVPGARKGLYRCDPPVEGHVFVVVSEIDSESLVFPASATGKITDWSELRISQKRRISAESLFEKAGYTVTKP